MGSAVHLGPTTRNSGSSPTGGAREPRLTCDDRSDGVRHFECRAPYSDFCAAFGLRTRGTPGGSGRCLGTRSGHPWHTCGAEPCPFNRAPCTRRTAGGSRRLPAPHPRRGGPAPGRPDRHLAHAAIPTPRLRAARVQSAEASATAWETCWRGSTNTPRPRTCAHRKESKPTRAQHPLSDHCSGPLALVMSKTRRSGAGPNDAHGTTVVWATPASLQSHTPKGKIWRSRLTWVPLSRPA